jgi:hypothetical protein
VFFVVGWGGAFAGGRTVIVFFVVIEVFFVFIGL